MVETIAKGVYGERKLPLEEKLKLSAELRQRAAEIAEQSGQVTYRFGPGHIVAPKGRPIGYGHRYESV